MVKFEEPDADTVNVWFSPGDRVIEAGLTVEELMAVQGVSVTFIQASVRSSLPILFCPFPDVIMAFIPTKLQ